MVAPLHGKMRMVLVPVFELPSYSIDAPSVGTFVGTGTLETSANFPPQPTILPQSGLHDFRRHCLRLHQPNLCLIQPPPPFRTLPTDWAGTHLPPFATSHPDPRDIHGQYPSNFDDMVSKGNKHDKGPHPSATEWIPEAPGRTKKNHCHHPLVPVLPPVLICATRLFPQGDPEANFYDPGSFTLHSKGCHEGSSRVLCSSCCTGPFSRCFEAHSH